MPNHNFTDNHSNYSDADRPNNSGSSGNYSDADRPNNSGSSGNYSNAEGYHEKGRGLNLDRYLEDGSAANAPEQDFLPKNDWGRFVPAILLFLITAALIWRGASTFQWPTVDGKVDHTSVGSLGRNSGGYPVHIQYSYSVSNSPYTGQSLVYAGSKDEIHSYREQFADGSRLSIYYNPQSPEDSVLRRGERAFEFVWFPGVLFVVALMSALCRNTYYQTRDANDIDRGLRTVISGQDQSRRR